MKKSLYSLCVLRKETLYSGTSLYRTPYNEDPVITNNIVRPGRITVKYVEFVMCSFVYLFTVSPISTVVLNTLDT